MTAIPSWARVGAKVVCVDAADTQSGGVPEIAEGVVYQIRWAGHYSDWYNGEYSGVRLVGIDRFDTAVLSDVAFKLFRFRPLITQQDDITTHFEQFLHTPQKIEERA